MVIRTSNPCASTNEIAFEIGRGTNPRGSLRRAAICSDTPHTVKSALHCFIIAVAIFGNVMGTVALILLCVCSSLDLSAPLLVELFALGVAFFLRPNVNMLGTVLEKTIIILILVMKGTNIK